MSTLPCSLHKAHAPRNLTVELHHVVPQSWQHAFTPTPAGIAPAGAVAGHGTEGVLWDAVVGHGAEGVLWDARTVPLCPTSHRNVHAALVAMVRGRPPVGSPLERRVARLAVSRALEAGITVEMLLAAHQYGEA